ncbi:carboxyltransferase domain-containing protein, partial [Enterococcus faecium]|uniref:carboxyltransferase domain-containing protein n=1 Tax=Enterococcus faecium TaxID=1352 RepID=UPI003F51FAC7
GVDLDDVARAHNISTSDVIAKHTGGDYRVAMIGFTPGFAYLSGLDPAIATPRRESPRTETPAGTISIGGVQACVQCLAAPS